MYDFQNFAPRTIGHDWNNGGGRGDACGQHCSPPPSRWRARVVVGRGREQGNNSSRRGRKAAQQQHALQWRGGAEREATVRTRESQRRRRARRIARGRECGWQRRRGAIREARQTEAAAGVMVLLLCRHDNEPAAAIEQAREFCGTCVRVSADEEERAARHRWTGKDKGKKGACEHFYLPTTTATASQSIVIQLRSYSSS
jgi:hypothetical protein